MKSLPVLLVFCAGAAMANDTFDDMLLRDGTVLKKVEVMEVTARGLKVKHSDGSGLIKSDQLPAEVTKRYAAAIAEAAKKERGEPTESVPANGVRLIPGLKSSAIVQICEKQGLKLTDHAAPIGREWTGSLKEKAADISVKVSGRGGETVAILTATVAGTGTVPDSTRAKTLFHALAEVKYTSADSAKAKNWITSNIDADSARTTIGGVSFHLTKPPGTANTRVLRIALP